MQIEAVEGTTADEALLLALHLVESEADERPVIMCGCLNKVTADILRRTRWP